MSALLTLESWARAVYGEDAPAQFTLRRWARDGHISPMPEKHGRSYFVKPDAKYVSHFVNNRLVNRIRGKTQGHA